MTGQSMFIALLASLLSLTSHAQQRPREDTNWYTVELIVFRYLQPDSTEIFPLLPELKYPDNVQSLEPGASFLDLDQGFELRGPEARKPIAAFSLESASPATPAEISAKAIETAPAAELTAEPSPQSSPELSPEMAAAGYRVPAAYVLLDTAAREFNSERKRISRSKNMRVLFHQAWRQPVLGRDQARSIKIESEANTDYPVLQGSIKLYVSRYLHLESNLWLNHTRADLPSDWAMPAPPLAPTSAPRSIDYEFRVALPAQAYFDPPGVVLDDLASVLLEGIDMATLPARLDAVGEPIVALDEAEFLALRFYTPFNHAVLLQQQRRMRSGELHYIDHPHLGLMIKLTPYEFSPIVPAAAGPESRRPAVPHAPTPQSLPPG